MEKEEEGERFVLSEIMTLQELIEKRYDDFPIILKTCENKNGADVPEYHEIGLPVDDLLMLEKRAELSYAYLQVMPLESDTAATADKGAEFTSEYNGFVDEKILIPLNYPSPIHIIHPPGRSKRYAVVSQVLEDLPRYIKVNMDTLTTPPSGYTCAPMAKMRSILEVTQVIESHNLRYLGCTSDTKEQFYFCENTLANFSAIQDTNTYTLSELLKSNVLLPKYVKFKTEPPLNDIISSSNTWINNSSVMTYGTMKLLGSKQKDVIIAWSRKGPSQLFRDETRPHYHVIIIPDARWSLEMVQIYKFKNSDSKREFVERYFPVQPDSGFVTNKLYVMRKEQSVVTSVDSNIELKDDENKVSEEEWEDWYATPGPPIPPRAPRTTDTSPSIQSQTKKHKLKSDTVRMLKEKARLGFGQLHKELLDVCSRAKEMVAQKKTTKSGSGVIKTKLSRSMSCEDGSDRRPLPPTPPDTPTDDVSDDKSVYDYMFEGFTNKTSKGKKSKDLRRHNTTAGRKADYEKLIAEDKSAKVGDQSKVEFSNYSVQEVVNCFKECALGELAEKCEEQRIDGALLTSLDLNSLKEEPFNMSEFKVRKVKMVINGWRPHYDSLQK